MTENEVVGFASLGLEPALVEAVAALGYEEPTPLQRQAIPPLLAGRDVVARAATGTGKTAAFALPLLQRLAAGARAGRSPKALVLVPTRELALHVAQAVRRYGRPHGAGVVAIYGGQPMGQQLRALDRGTDVLVATPGRALDHLRRGSLSLADVRAVVLDEADEMLDLGFADDVEALLEAAPAGTQLALFSAALPERLAGLAERRLREGVRLAPEAVVPTDLPRVRQVAYLVPRGSKLSALDRVLDLEAPASTLVFCRTRPGAAALAEALDARGLRVAALHGGLAPEERDGVVRRFREGAVDLLVTTDAGVRGLAVARASHVVSFDVPPSAGLYLERLGRAGGAGAEGVVVTLALSRELPVVREVEKLTGRRVERSVLPGIADIHARRLERTLSALGEAIAGGGLDRFRTVVDALASEFDLLDVAAAAVKLAHAARGGEEDEGEAVPAAAARPGEPAGPTPTAAPAPTAPPAPPAAERRPRRAVDREAAGSDDRPRLRRPSEGERERRPARRDEEAPRTRFRDDEERRPRPRGGEGGWRGGQGGRSSEGEADRGRPRPWERGERAPERPREGYPQRRGGRPTGVGMVKVYVSAGHEAGIRPGDVVGLVTRGAGLEAAAVGAIDVSERHTIVEVRAGDVDTVLAALRGTPLRGHRVTASVLKPRPPRS